MLLSVSLSNKSREWKESILVKTANISIFINKVVHHACENIKQKTLDTLKIACGDSWFAFLFFCINLMLPRQEGRYTRLNMISPEWSARHSVGMHDSLKVAPRASFDSGKSCYSGSWWCNERHWFFPFLFFLLSFSFFFIFIYLFIFLAPIQQISRGRNIESGDDRLH